MILRESPREMRFISPSPDEAQFISAHVSYPCLGSVTNLFDRGSHRGIFGIFCYSTTMTLALAREIAFFTAGVPHTLIEIHDLFSPASQEGVPATVESAHCTVNCKFKEHFTCQMQKLQSNTI